MAKIDAKECAAQIVKCVGGPENVKSVAHCMTRARFVVKDVNKADQEAIKDIKGVMGCIYSGGQLQVILGANLLPVFEQIVKQNDFKQDDVIDENLDGKEMGKKNIGGAILGYVQAAVTPLVAGLVAGGILKVILMLLPYVWPEFAETTTNSVLGWVANAPFYFMPIFVAYGAAKKLGGTEIYAMVVTAALLTPEWVAAVSEETAITIFGIPCRGITYNGQLLPALLIPIAAYYIEKFLNKIIPGIIKSLLVGSGTILVTGALAFSILGPAGRYVGDAISGVFMFLGDNVPFIAVAVLAACLPWMIMAGMHTALSPFMVSNLETIGYDAVIRPAFVLHNVSEGGACLGVALRTKDKEFRSECLSLAVSAIVAGVTEPTIYGCNLKYKKPMFGVMGGAAIGGGVAAVLGAKAVVMGYSNMLAVLPMFMNTAWAMFVGAAVAIVSAAAIAFVLGIDEGKKK